jgi:predicted AAA+ superfamily ATPase
MVPREAEGSVRRLAGHFPAVLILGPRQCGKTTLARHFVRGSYFDLEKPSDAQVFSGDAEFALRRIRSPLILDEAQALPSLFPILRALIDEARQKYGRFFLLGSVSPELVRNISESLAGRVGIIELTPFLSTEVGGYGETALRHLWLRGGFPDAFLTRDASRWQAWQESFLRTFVERDIVRHGLKISSLEMRRLLGMVAHSHGGILNASSLGRSLGYSYHTIQHVLDLLEGHFLIRRLQPWHANLGKRLVKAPKLYVRDTGVLHHLLGIVAGEDLLRSPSRGNSFEGFMIEQVAAQESLARPGSRFHYYRTHAGAEIDLVVDRGQTRIGFEFKCASFAGPSDWMNLRNGIAEGIIHRGYVVYLGERSFSVCQEIAVVPARELLRSGWDEPRRPRRTDDPRSPGKSA